FADMGMIAYEMNLLVKRVGVYLSSAPRNNQLADLDNGRMV
ncbi:MAG TPA: roadblock/LC7 domain-containing protein, partial [Pseudonocardiaceae bacterium]